MKKTSKLKAGRPLLGINRRVLLTISIDPITADYLKRNGKKYGSRGQIIDRALTRLIRKEKK